MCASKVKNKAPKGKVYVLTNDLMPGIVKIGYTTQSIIERLKELDATIGNTSKDQHSSHMMELF